MSFQKSAPKSASLILLIFAIFARPAEMQTPNKPNLEIKKAEIDWPDKLYADDVAYEDFACRVEDRPAVADFFKAWPRRRSLPICHNNCPILKSFPQRKLPPLSPEITGRGNIAIHIVADENGRPIYARALNGHSLLRSLLQKRACESQFETNSGKRQRLILYCPNDEKCDRLQPVRQ